MERFFGEQGALAGVLPGFEHRRGQVEMAEAVSGVLDQGGAILAEAGTGIGKTLAYLIPAILSGQKVIVSTGTKNLQEQIIGKDIPVAEKLFPEKFKAAMMKGRGNYLCRRRLKNFAQQPLFNTKDEGTLFAEIQNWAFKTLTGDRAELEEMPDDYSAWSDINSKSELCLGSKCEYYEECFVTEMRKEAAAADLVVVNHHLFFADLGLRDKSMGEVIPGYDAVVFDEAHMVEETATSYFGASLSNYRIFEATRDTSRELRAAGIKDKEYERLLDNIQTRAAEFFDSVRTGAAQRRRLKKPDKARWEGRAAELINSLSLASDSLGSIKSSSDPVKALSIRFADIAELVGEMTRMDNDANVYWAEERGRGVFLHSSPIDVSAHLKEKLYPRSGAVVFTSATLTTGGDFSFIRSRLGLDELAPDEHAIPSPFDYQSQAALYLPRDLPEPASAAFTDSAAKRIEALLKISLGRAFVLFTSHRNLEKCWELLDGKIPHATLKQGDAPRSVILDRFREDKSSCLFATSSFWQGVDVKGEALSAVIIDKLPFATPDDPLVAARIEYIEKRGGSGFKDYQLPSAVLSLKQGLGRLVRSTEDTGLLAVLDKRIKTKSYGKSFLGALPDMPVFEDLAQMEKHAAKWWG